jgi:hypothetical protein
MCILVMWFEGFISFTGSFVSDQLFKSECMTE